VLTNTKILRLKATGKVYRVLDSDALYIEVRPEGGRWWRYRFVRADGERTMVSLGQYPDVSIEEARAERDRRKSSGIDEVLFKDAARQWFTHKNYASDKNSAMMWRRIERYLLPSLGKMVIGNIKPKHVLPVLKSIEKSGHLELARRMRTTASQIFRYGVVNLMCDSDPAYLLQGATKMPVVKHMAAITDEKGFGDLLRRIDASDSLMPTVKFCLQVAPYVFLRSGEIRNSVPGHVDIDNRLWTLPAEFMKMKKDLLVPLHDSVIVSLENALQFSYGDFIFCGQRRGRPISENTLNMALRSLGYALGDVTFHGFRSSFSTLGREMLRFEDNLIERQLAHVDKNNVRAVYDRSYRIEERTVMMMQWGDYLDALRQQKTGQ